MLDLFLCHSRADREVAADIAARLERMVEGRASLEECNPAAGETVASAWEAGVYSAAILLLLSPEAVPRERTRTVWQSVLDHLERHASPPLGSVLLRDCAYARLLERRHFFRWSDGRTAVLRALASWLLALHPASETKLFLPARLPWFRGRTGELDLLWRKLVDDAGTVVLAGDPGSGKTALAQEFARGAAGHFRDILWIDCGGRSPGFIAGDLESQLGIRPNERVEHGFEQLAAFAVEHRLLLVLDDVAGEPLVVAPPEGRASMLITTRSAGIPLPAHVTVLALDGTGGDGSNRPPADPTCERLWRAMAACRRNGFPLDLAAAMAGLDGDAARGACERLVAEGFVDSLDDAGARFRLSARSQEAALSTPDSEALRRAHARALDAAFAGPRPRAPIAELEHGLQWALRNDWDLALGLARRGFQFLKAEGRLREAARVYELLREQAHERGDADLAEQCSWELSWIRDEPGEIRRSATGGQQLALEFN